MSADRTERANSSKNKEEVKTDQNDSDRQLLKLPGEVEAVFVDLIVDIVKKKRQVQE